jgi:hypothetical protein
MLHQLVVFFRMFTELNQNFENGSSRWGLIRRMSQTEMKLIASCALYIG